MDFLDNPVCQKIDKMRPIQLSFSHKHQAFTDLISFKGQMFCCFREATDHISGDGALAVYALSESGQVNAKTKLSMPSCDLRDPKLSLMPNGNLLLSAYARFVKEDNKNRYGQAICWVSQNGKSWSSPHFFGERNWWLWRVTWHHGQAYGFAYNRNAQAIRLFTGNPTKAMFALGKPSLSLAKHGLGYPNESDIWFAPNGVAYAIVRRDADTCTAQMGVAKPPYHRWDWHDLGEYIGGPALLSLDSENLLVAGRLWRTPSPQTALWNLDVKQAKLKLLSVMPSTGDCSYPGLTRHNNKVFMSYYSSHVDNSSNVFLTEIPPSLIAR